MKKLIVRIDVEIAETLDEIETGMMLRENNDDNHGMLFIFEFDEEVSFWMKNTAIPLDIIFANKSKQIVSIYRDAQPFDTTNHPSLKPVKYVVEVNGGFTDKYKIEEGYYMDWRRY